MSRQLALRTFRKDLEAKAEKVYFQGIGEFVGAPRGLTGTSRPQMEELILSCMKHALYELHIRPQNGDFTAVLQDYLT